MPLISGQTRFGVEALAHRRRWPYAALPLRVVSNPNTLEIGAVRRFACALNLRQHHLRRRGVSSQVTLPLRHATFENGVLPQTPLEIALLGALLMPLTSRQTTSSDRLYTLSAPLSLHWQQLAASKYPLACLFSHFYVDTNPSAGYRVPLHRYASSLRCKSQCSVFYLAALGLILAVHPCRCNKLQVISYNHRTLCSSGQNLVPRCIPSCTP